MTIEAHLATLYEAIADELGERLALVHGDLERSWSDYDDRAARVSAGLAGAGLGAGSKVGLYLYNGPEYLEVQHAAFKLRGVPVNINYRYRDQELAYLLANSDSEALFFHSSLAAIVERAVGTIAGVKFLVQVADDDTPLIDGAIAYETLVAATDPAPRQRRSENDLFMLYTGGTTGLPKGVMFRLGSLTGAFVAGALGQVGLDPATPLERIPALAAALDDSEHLVSVPCAPLMHGTGLTLGAMSPQCVGASVVTLESRSFDAHELMQVVQRRRVTNLTIVGDAISKPILAAIDEQAATGRPYDATSLRRVYSSGVMWSAETKAALLDRIPQVTLNDVMSSSEGAMATQVTVASEGATTARFVLNPTTKVFHESGREVAPGSGEIGMIAASGNIPMGYYKDEAKTAVTFREIDGVAYSFPGDMAEVAADGSIILLGRGSQVINTGGEKVFPEEVEEAVKRVPGIVDCLVVGVDDERFGQAVTAVVSTDPGMPLDPQHVIATVKSELAGYKAPKRIVIVDEVPRAPNGKADHKGARQMAMAQLFAQLSPDATG